MRFHVSYDAEVSLRPQPTEKPSSEVSDEDIFERRFMSYIRIQNPIIAKAYSISNNGEGKRKKGFSPPVATTFVNGTH